MDLRLFGTVFVTIFVAELGDKTQLATLLYAANAEHGRWVVFSAAASALVLSAGLGVAAGTLVSQYLDPKTLSRVAGIGFVAIGIWTLWRS